MPEAFVIMQIGDEELDSVYESTYVPALEAAGLTPRRVDKHNSGELLKSEIVRFIERSDVIVADVTNERPNCYLEIGYAMGLGKFRNLVLTARADHHHSHPKFRQNGPRVHFDLEGYEILLWDPADLSSFEERLTSSVARRSRIANKKMTRQSGPSSTYVNESDSPAEVHDAILTALGEQDQIRLSEALRRERNLYDRRLFSMMEALATDSPQPSLERVESVWTELEPVLDRRLAGLLPLCMYDRERFAAELSSLSRVLEKQPVRGGYELWNQLGEFAANWLGYVTGALAVATDRFEMVRPILEQYWTDRYQDRNPLVSGPTEFGHLLGKARIEGNWLSPFWEFMVRSLDSKDWIRTRHAELFVESEPDASMSIFDLMLCIHRGIRGETTIPHWSLGRRTTRAFADRLKRDAELRGRVASAVGVSVDDFEIGAANALNRSYRFNGGFSDFDFVVDSLQQLHARA